jgi:hypothetical protein
MKTPGRITATLIALLTLYVLGYWLFFKKGWYYDLLGYSLHSEIMQWTTGTLYTVFTPMRKLDRHLNLEIPMRNQLIGDWQSHTTTDNVVISPNLDCHFQLGDFVFAGKVEYDPLIDGLSAKFQHQGQNQIFSFTLGSQNDPFEVVNPFGSESGEVKAHASVGRETSPSLPPVIDYETGLTKHPPSTPAP